MPPPPEAEPLNLVQKKVRNLNKNLRLLSLRSFGLTLRLLAQSDKELKGKAARGECLEATQRTKSRTEDREQCGDSEVSRVRRA